MSKLQDHFIGVAAKQLTKVDAEPLVSNQHEIGGLVKAGFAEFIGLPQGGEVRTLKCRMSYLSDEEDGSLFEDDFVSWYDSRYSDPKRSAEYRLYYRKNPITQKIAEGDLMVVAYKSDEDLQIIFASKDSQSEAELKNLFGLTQLSSTLARFRPRDMNVGLPIRLVLENVGIVLDTHIETSTALENMLSMFGDNYPDTKTFSNFARQMSGPVESLTPDERLLRWMECEEDLFRVFERHIVGKELQAGFGEEDEQVDNFIRFSLSVQNRRKSRAGHAFENHLEELFTSVGLDFEKGSSTRTTENNSKPDFLFPGFEQYHDQTFPEERLTLLGAKTSCKDRWRQVLSEGGRISNKHLVTLQLGVSTTQLAEMKANNLDLVVPKGIHDLYSKRDRDQILSIEEFISIVKTRSSASNQGFA